MLLLSDFQLLTGLSIMISGFTQLRCGISIYHWHKVVRLAWFSSITHLCCLTFLRDYFQHHKLAQLWRVPGMVILVIMLIVALIPTAQYTWYFDGHLSLGDIVKFVSRPAVCSFFPSQNSGGFTSRAGNQRAGISISLLCLGLLLRLCRLYDTPGDIYFKIRMWCSSGTKSLLQKLLDWCKADSGFGLLGIICLYRPLLTIFLCYRILFDVASSKVFEVLWFPI